MNAELQKYGRRIEEWVAEQLKRHGYESVPLPGWTDKGDEKVFASPQTVLVETKGARKTMRQVRPGYHRPNWNFDTARLQEGLDHVVVLVVEDEKGKLWPFVIPSWAVFGRSSVNITSHPKKYKGMFAEYLGTWDVIDQVSYQRARIVQQPLFDL